VLADEADLLAVARIVGDDPLRALGRGGVEHVRGGVKRERHDLGAAVGNRFLAGLILTAQRDPGNHPAGHEDGSGQHGGGLPASTKLPRNSPASSGPVMASRVVRA
jgi:hypothetical protein